MIALITEKPSVAKDIARIIGTTQRNDGYLSGNGYMVTWAFGHLIQLAMPEAYGVANFRRESLPILPPDFQLIPRQVKAEKGYKADPRRAETVESDKGSVRPVRPDYCRHRCRT